MEYALLLLIFPVVWPFIAKSVWKHRFSWQEAGVNAAIVSALVVAIYFTGHLYQTVDTEVWNGEVVGKTSERVSCSHSYSCNCRESCFGSGRDRTCSQTCDTCYEHSYDVDWNVQSSVGGFTIDRVDRQGIHTPPRWSKVMMHDPVATSKLYTNYIKGAPDTLFNKQEYKDNPYIASVPEYPSHVYDYQYIDRALSVGVAVPNMREWNTEIANALRARGPSKQVNYVIIFTKTDHAFADAVKYKWLGGKKNDVVVVIGAPKYPAVEWVEVISWSTKNIFHTELADAIESAGDLAPQKTVALINQHVDRSFSRMHMRDYVYLRDDIQPPVWMVIIAALISVLGSVGITLYIIKKNNKRVNYRWM